MTAPADPPSLLDWIEKIVAPAVTFVAGFVVSRFTLTKKDQKDLEQKNYENSKSLVDQHDSAYASYTGALATYNDSALASANDFVAIATTGDRYFYVLGLMSAAILSDKVDPTLRDKVFLRKIIEATARTLPSHYDALQTIAQKYGFPYSGALRLADYDALYEVVAKHGKELDWANG